VSVILSREPRKINIVIVVGLFYLDPQKIVRTIAYTKLPGGYCKTAIIILVTNYYESDQKIVSVRVDTKISDVSQKLGAVKVCTNYSGLLSGTVSHRDH
jgi:hypothetical protein